MKKGTVKVYTCAKPNCGKTTKTANRDEGVTPFIVSCIHCGGVARAEVLDKKQDGENIDLVWINPRSEAEWDMFMDGVMDHENVSKMNQGRINDIKKQIEVTSRLHVEKGGVVCVSAEKIGWV